MDNETIGRILDEIAFWLEIAGENPFKIRSYANAARLIEKLGEPVALLHSDGRLRELEGVGEALEKKIVEMLTTGRLPYLEELRARFPEGLLELSRLQGIGAKTIKTLFEALQIDSLESLREACEHGTVAKLKGFGDKKQQKILDALDFLDAQQGRFHIHTAQSTAHDLCKHLRAHPSVNNVAIAGSLRRFRETVKDIDLLVAGEDAGAIMEHFVNAPKVQRIVSKGLKKSAVVTNADIPVDLRVVHKEQWPFALLHFTGSKEHNVLLRRRAGELNLKLNEYGLFQEDGACVPCKSETDIYKALGLPYVPPELREGLFEFDLPRPLRLVEEKDLVGAFHCHSDWSDGVNTMEEMACAAQAWGYAYLVMTDHSQSSVLVNGLTPERVLAQQEAIDALNERLEGIRIVKGIEADILGDGALDFEDDVLKTFEFVIASVHGGFEMSAEESASRIIRAIENPYTSLIGHITGRLLLSREGYPVHMEKIVDAAIANGVALEINANPRRLDMDWRHLREAADKGAMFVIGPDAHRIAGLGNVRFGIGIARKGGLTPDHLLNCKPMEDIIRWRGKK